MMNKYDELLNALVYEIDNLVYDFYSKSNELIAHKSGQEQLLDFRDKSVDTINTMNIRSLEMISQLKKQEVLEERAEHLIAKNKELISSSLDVIQAAPNKSELLEDLGKLSSNMYESAKEVVTKVEESGVIDRFINKTKDTFDDIANHPNVKKGTEAMKEKTKEFVDAGSKQLKKGGEKLSEWFDELEDKAKEGSEKTTEVLHEVVEESKEFAEHANDSIQEGLDEGLEKSEKFVDELSKDVEDASSKAKDYVEEKVDDLSEKSEEVKDEAVEKLEDFGEEAEKKWADIKESTDEIDDNIIVFLEKSEKKVQDAIDDLEQEDKVNEESNDL